ncbi:MAG: CDP-alcohol phosphatidyltransferase family protein [Chloroflexi bacterium]|nr:CDP-alcohol phosphatidyltransferase family protein [Chloroflexota bacterium]
MFSNLAREKFQVVVLVIARPLANAGVSPNLLTFAGFLATVGVAAIIGIGQFLLAGLLLIPASFFDALDGNVARLENRASPFGAFLDSNLDRYAEIALFGGLLYFYATRGDFLGIALTYLALAGSLMVSYARARAEGAGFQAKDVGIFTRLERFIVLVGGLLLGQWSATLLTAALVILALGSHLTAVQRMWHVQRMSKNPRAN